MHALLLYPGFPDTFWSFKHALQFVRKVSGFRAPSKGNQAAFSAAVSDYLEHRTNLCLVFALIDSGLAPQAMDLEFVDWLVRHEVPFVFVFTKTDKVTPATARANIAGMSSIKG